MATPARPFVCLFFLLCFGARAQEFTTVIFYQPYIERGKKELEIAVDGNRVARLPVARRFVLRLAPGTHTFSVPNDKPGAGEYLLEAGKVYYIRTRLAMLSAWKAKRVFESEADLNTARQKVDDLKLISPKQVHDCSLVVQPSCAR